MKRHDIYFDYNATTPLRRGVADIQLTHMKVPGNASSVHNFGRAARQTVETARSQVAKLAGCQTEAVTFTSGATECNNMVIHAFRKDGILFSAIEHPSICDPAEGAPMIPVTPDGLIDEDALESMVKEHAPALVSIMMANNETGVIQDIAKLARLLRKLDPRIHIHCDAVQAAGKIPLDFPALQVDYLSLSAHKLGGPLGVGALIASPGSRSVRLISGGGQERGVRAGTENVPGIAGFGKACEMAASEMTETSSRIRTLRDRLESELKKITPDLIIFSKKAPRLPNTSAFALPGTQAQTILMALDLEGIAVSSGSACSSGKVKTSRVISSLGYEGDEIAGQSIRVSLGWTNTDHEVDHFLDVWEKRVKPMQKL